MNKIIAAFKRLPAPARKVIVRLALVALGGALTAVTTYVAGNSASVPAASVVILVLREVDKALASYERGVK